MSNFKYLIIWDLDTLNRLEIQCRVLWMRQKYLDWTFQYINTWYNLTLFYPCVDVWKNRICGKKIVLKMDCCFCVTTPQLWALHFQPKTHFFLIQYMHAFEVIPVDTFKQTKMWREKLLVIHQIIGKIINWPISFYL